ncbi:MAG TPA: MFS transporter [Actinomycetota bacterium]
MSAPARPNPLRTSPSFRRLWLARTSSHVGDGIALVALVLLVQGSEGSGTAVGALLLASSLPRFLGPLAGVLADRVEQRRLMVLCDLGNASIFAAIAGFQPSFGVLLMLVAASAILDTLFAPAGRSAVPALVHADDLLQANAWMGTSLNLQVALGTLLGGVLVAAIGVRGALAFDASSFLLSAALLIGLPHLRSTVSGTPSGFLAVGREGLAFAWRTRVVRTFLIVLFLGVAFAALDNVALVFLVRETLGGGPVAFGLVSAAFGAGMIAASVGLSIRRTSAAVTTLLIVAWLATGIGTIATGLAPLIAVAAIAQTIGGFGNGLENVAADTLIQRAVPREMLGRVFGLVSTAAFGGSTLAYAAGGPLLDLTSTRSVFLIAGAGIFAVTAILWIALRRDAGSLGVRTRESRLRGQGRSIWRRP